MLTRKWLVIARNEYRITTSRIRGVRPYFPFLATGLLVVYVAFIAPVLVSNFVDEFTAFITSVAAVPMVQIMLFMFTFYLILFPISDTLREIRTDQIEIFLAAPVKPGDVLLGEFLGKMPFYAIVIAIITGTFTALLNPLGLDSIQKAIIVIVFIITFLSAFWIGTVIAAILRTKLGKTMHGRDVGKALSVVIVLPMIAVMYATIGGGLLKSLMDLKANETVKAVLSLLPSSWGAEIFVAFASHPGNIGVVYFETLTRLGGIVAFFVVALWLGSKAASRAYSLESYAFAALRAKPDGLFYGAVRRLGGGGSSGTLLATTMKDYGRRLENLSWIVYAVGIVAMMVLFLSGPFEDQQDPLFMLSEMAIPFLTGFTVGTVSRGKETLFIYKKSPNGIGRFVRARQLQACLVTVPIAAAIAVISTFLAPQATPFSLLVNVAFVTLRTVVSVAFLLGLAILVPVFSDESRERTMSVAIYFMALIFFTIGLGIGFSPKRLFPNVDSYAGMLYAYLLQTAIISLVGLALLYLGKRKLDSIE